MATFDLLLGIGVILGITYCFVSWNKSKELPKNLRVKNLRMTISLMVIVVMFVILLGYKCGWNSALLGLFK